MQYKTTSFGVQKDGDSCGFWAATIALLLLFGVNLKEETNCEQLNRVLLSKVKSCWIEMATMFRCDKAGIHKQPVLTLLDGFVHESGKILDDTEIVS